MTNSRDDDPDEDSEEVQLPPGTYQVDQHGNIQPVANLQPIVEQFDWENADQLIREWLERGSAERKIDLYGMYILVGLVVVLASWLAVEGILQGQAIAGFLGAAIGYLLSRARVGSGE